MIPLGIRELGARARKEYKTMFLGVGTERTEENEYEDRHWSIIDFVGVR